ncbi:MAG: hypothetical protein HUJ53_08745, partial [Holdemanella sp.]|nr:hypothetical protein [Holdemanella sp.]
MNIYENVKNSFIESVNIHYVNEEDIFSNYFDTEHLSTRKKNYMHTRSTQLISASACLYKNNLISVLRHIDKQPHIFHFSERKLTSYKSDYIEIRYVLQGILTEKIDEEIIHAKKDDILIIASDFNHCDILEESDAVVLNLTVSHELFNQVFFNKLEDNPLSEFLRKSIFYYNQNNGYLLFETENETIRNQVLQYVYNFYEEIKYKEPGYIDICVGNLVRLFTACSRNYAFNLSKSERKICKAIANS